MADAGGTSVCDIALAPDLGRKSSRSKWFEGFTTLHRWPVSSPSEIDAERVKYAFSLEAVRVSEALVRVDAAFSPGLRNSSTPTAR